MSDGQPDLGDEELARSARRWKLKIIVSTWLSYAGYYFCRKPFYKAKATLHQQLGFGTSQLGWVGFGYLCAYSLGQFTAAGVGTRTGPRRMLLAGMSASILCNVAAGSIAGFTPLLIAMSINGLVQATGWPGNVGTMAAWTRRDERGTIMGLWSTCYQVGGLLAGVLASMLIGTSLGWRAPFYGGAVVLLAVVGLFFLWQRDRPEDVGLPPTEPLAQPSSSPTAAAGRRLGWPLRTHITVLLMGCIYACVKFIRYLLLSWAAYFLQLNFKLSPRKAGLYSDVFDLAGVFGAVSGGVVSDRAFAGRRTPVIIAMLLLMTLSCLFLWQWGTRSVVLFMVGLSAVGFMLYGPDSLLSGAGAMDVGGKNGAVAAAGIINGMGSLGSVIQERVVGQLFGHKEGLAQIFMALTAAGTVALLLCCVQAWRNRTSDSPL